MADDPLKKAAADAMKAGEDVTRRFRDLTLDALKNRRFDREGIRETVRAVTEGMAAAAPASGGSLRQAMGQAFRGMDEALKVADYVYVIGDGVILGKGTSKEVAASEDPYLKQFVNALPDGPVRFHFPGPPLEEDLRIHG